jgi:hypothetical protein
VDEKQRLTQLSFTSSRRFGLEIELNAFDGKTRPPDGKLPEGMDYVCRLVHNNAEEGAEMRNWEHTTGNAKWVIKPDSSCGIEVCSPPLKGWRGINKVVQVVEAFSGDARIRADDHCSVHVHVEVKDLSEEQIGSVIAYWIKSEPVFLDAMPPERKRNRYCQFIGMTDLLDTNITYDPRTLISRVGNVKYYTANTNMMMKSGGERKTLEFRIIEGSGAKDPYLIKNWTRLILHFVEQASKLPFPGPYYDSSRSTDPTELRKTSWSHLVWLDTKAVLEIFGFYGEPPQYALSNALAQTRNWFLARLQKYISTEHPRRKAYDELKQVLMVLEGNGININPQDHLSPTDLKHELYHEEFRY